MLRLYRAAAAQTASAAEPISDNGCMDPEPAAQPQPPALAPEDYYFDGPYMVFTAAYHLKRGYCCGSGCRHCPYRDNAEPKIAEK